MALILEDNSDVEIAVTLRDSFVQGVPEYFTVNEGKLYHDHNKVNVFAHSRKLFVHSLGEVLTVNNETEFTSIKQHLLGNPIFLEVHLKKEKKSGNTSVITRGDFIVLINPKQRDIQWQLRNRLDEAEEIMKQGKHFAIEIKLGQVLQNWYKSRFPDGNASYESSGSNFCITNFSQRMHMCYEPLTWLVCFPCLILTAPFYCVHRKLKCIDRILKLTAEVRYVEALSHEDRLILREAITTAYMAGLNSGQHPPVIDEDLPEYEEMERTYHFEDSPDNI